MKTAVGGGLLILLAVVALSVLPVQAKRSNAEKPSEPAQQAGNVPASTFEQQSVVVEDLAVEVHSDIGIFTVTANIKNVSRAMISGYATIHLLSGEGKRVLSYEEEINGGEPFAHGTTVEFEMTARIGDIKNISSISVVFTRN